MGKKVDTSQWTFEDFHTFLLVYAAEADFVIREEERQFIIDKIGEPRFLKFLALFKEMKDIDRIEVVYQFRDQYCKTEEDSNKTLQELKEMLQSGDGINPMEEEILISIKRILKH